MKKQLKFILFVVMISPLMLSGFTAGLLYQSFYAGWLNAGNWMEKLYKEGTKKI